jgi:hypothetical protein
MSEPIFVLTVTLLLFQIAVEAVRLYKVARQK